MLKTRLYVDCPHCHMQYLMKDFGLTYSNGAYIENVAGSPEWQRLTCPCEPQNPYKFKLKERTRLHVFQENESEQTHFSLKPVRAIAVPAAASKSQVAGASENGRNVENPLLSLAVDDFLSPYSH
jgi:hypothetical protein